MASNKGDMPNPELSGMSRTVPPASRNRAICAHSPAEGRWMPLATRTSKPTRFWVEGRLEARVTESSGEAEAKAWCALPRHAHNLESPTRVQPPTSKRQMLSLGVQLGHDVLEELMCTMLALDTLMPAIKPTLKVPQFCSNMKPHASCFDAPGPKRLPHSNTLPRPSHTPCLGQPTENVAEQSVSSI